ncbi:MAG TPA: type II toxin-antitoxin system RelE/ParE family toxin [Terriglobia bacterium]|nr:type II toxin-antitoxin system RelE/ParE family toxin [Terriglobia bacterium]
MNYKVTIFSAAARQLASLPDPDRKRVRERIVRLGIEPRPPDVKKLQGKRDLFRIRCGNYRIIFMVKDVELAVIVVRIGHRRDVYRGL